MMTPEFLPLLYNMISEEIYGYDATEPLRYASTVLPLLIQKTPAKFENKAFSFLYKYITEYNIAPSRKVFFTEIPALLAAEEQSDLAEFSGRISGGTLFYMDAADTQFLLDRYEQGRDFYLFQQTFTTAMEINRAPVKIDGHELMGFDAALDYTQRKLSNLGSSASKVLHHALAEDGRDLHSYYLHDKCEQLTAKRIKCGLSAIDQIVNGFRPGELITLMGYTGDGKTTVCVNWAYRAFLTGLHVAYITLEMPADEIKKRFHILHATHPKFGHAPIKASDYLDYKLSLADEEFMFTKVVPDFDTAVSGLGSIRVLEPLDSGFTYDTLKAELLKLNADQPLDAFYLDYPNLMEIQTERGMDYDRAMSRLYVRLKTLCRTFNSGQRITGIIPTQVNKAGRQAAENNDGVYTLRAINQYSEIPNSSDFVFFTYRDKTLIDQDECIIGGLKARRCAPPDPFRATFNGGYCLVADIVRNTPVSLPNGGMNAVSPGALNMLGGLDA